MFHPRNDDSRHMQLTEIATPKPSKWASRAAGSPTRERACTPRPPISLESPLRIAVKPFCHLHTKNSEGFLLNHVVGNAGFVCRLDRL